MPVPRSEASQSADFFQSFTEGYKNLKDGNAVSISSSSNTPVRRSQSFDAVFRREKPARLDGDTVRRKLRPAQADQSQNNTSPSSLNQTQHPMLSNPLLNWQSAEEIFYALDTDKSGDIDMKELQDMILDQGYSPRVAQLLMDELDADKNGRITLEELRNGLASSTFVPAKPFSKTSWKIIIVGMFYFPVGILVYGALEGWSPLEAVYFLLVTATTVGYGDLCPSTRFGRLFTVFYALLGITIVLSALTPLIDMLQNLIDALEEYLTGCLERFKIIPPAVDTLDLSLTIAQVNASISYKRRYLLALGNPIVMFIIGWILAKYFVVESGDWIDELYFVIISMTTIGYGDLAPTSAVGRILIMLYLPIAVASLAQALSDISAINVRRAIRETNYSDKLAAHFLKAECTRTGNRDESITEAEFLVSVLLRRDIVDEMTLAAVRRQFRELVRDETDDTTPLENRHFDSQRLFGMMVRTGQIRQRPPNMAPGSRTPGYSRAPLVDLRDTVDGGFSEWRTYFWEPELEARLPPRKQIESKERSIRNQGGFRVGKLHAPPGFGLGQNAVSVGGKLIAAPFKMLGSVLTQGESSKDASQASRNAQEMI